MMDVQDVPSEVSLQLFDLYQSLMPWEHRSYTLDTAITIQPRVRQSKGKSGMQGRLLSNLILLI